MTPNSFAPLGLVRRPQGVGNRSVAPALRENDQAIRSKRVWKSGRTHPATCPTKLVRGEIRKISTEPSPSAVDLDSDLDFSLSDDSSVERVAPIPATKGSHMLLMHPQVWRGGRAVPLRQDPPTSIVVTSPVCGGNMCWFPIDSFSLGPTPVHRRSIQSSIDPVSFLNLTGALTTC